MPYAISKAGELVTIGNFTKYGVPTRTTNGSLVVPDAGVPLANYAPGRVDPLAMWKKHPALRKVVDFAARQVGSLNWHVYERVSTTDRVRLVGSPAERALNAPGRFVTGYHFWHDITVDVMLYDLWAFIFTGAELVRIPPSRVVVTSNFLGQVTKVEMIMDPGARRKDGSHYENDREDITDWPLCIGWGWAPTAAGGVSPLSTLADLLDESATSVQWRKDQWKNHPKFNAYITRPVEAGKWDDTKRDRFVNSMRGWRQQTENTAPILEDGMEMKEMPKGPTSKDALDLDARKLTDVEVASAYHIPPELVGAREGNFSNMQAFRQMLHGPTLGPQYKEFEQAVNQMILHHMDGTPGIYAELDREAALNGSFLEQAVIMSTAIGGPWLSRNEGRSKFNLPAKDGGDELITPMNVTVGGQASPQDSGSQNVTGAPKKMLLIPGNPEQHAGIVTADTPEGAK